MPGATQTFPFSTEVFPTRHPSLCLPMPSEKPAPDPAFSAAEFVQKRFGEAPADGIILGSGLSVHGEETGAVSYAQVPGMPAAGVGGHSGVLRVLEIGGRSTAALSGRSHLYEGAGWDEVTFTVRMLARWGIRRLIVTNAAGGLSPELKVGDLLLVTHVLDLLSPECRESGVLQRLAAGPACVGNDLSDRIAATRPELAKGTYAAVLGPNYETAAEVRALRHAGADAVGMSTAPELRASRECGVPAACISVITNSWSRPTEFHGHDSVLEVAGRASASLQGLVESLYEHES